LRFELQRTAALNRGGSVPGVTQEQSTTITQQQAEIQDLAAHGQARDDVGCEAISGAVLGGYHFSPERTENAFRHSLYFQEFRMNYLQCAKSHRIGTGLLLAVLALTVAGAARVPHPNVVLFDVRVGILTLT
jgi:hypothetical protein